MTADDSGATTDEEATLTDPEPTTAAHPGGPRADDEPFPAVAAAVRAYLAGDASGHDVHHAWRVFRLGLDLAAETGADPEVVGAAALTHDLHRVLGEGTGLDPAETTDEVRAVLEAAGFPDEKVPAVQHCVAVHDEYEFRGSDRPAESLEAEVLRDADNLDAMGAVGVARTFAFAGVHGMPLFDPDGETYSPLYHFEDKLLRLREEMHTEPAREIAADRHEFLATFRERFLREWHGER